MTMKIEIKQVGQDKVSDLEKVLMNLNTTTLYEVLDDIDLSGISHTKTRCKTACNRGNRIDYSGRYGFHNDSARSTINPLFQQICDTIIAQLSAGEIMTHILWQGNLDGLVKVQV